MVTVFSLDPAKGVWHSQAALKKKGFDMRLGKTLAALAAVTLSASPVLAQSSAASALSLSSARAGASLEDESNMGGGNVLVIVLALAAVIGGIIVIADGSDDLPTSP